MLVVQMKDKSCATLYVTQDLTPFLDVIEDVVRVYASGDELEYITNVLINIPLTVRGNGIIWYGDIARTILLNLW